MEVNHILRENWLSILFIVLMGFCKITEDQIVKLENYMSSYMSSDEQETRRIQAAVSLVFNLCLA